MKEIPVPRGSFISGQDSLFNALYPKRDDDGMKIKYDYIPHPRTLWRWLEALETMLCIKIENLSNRASMITVCNYCTYQDIVDDNCRTGAEPVPNRCQADVKPVPTIEEGKKEKKVKKKEASPRLRNPIFDAIVSVTGTDPKLNGPQIGKASAAISAAGYTVEQILEFGRRFHELCPWSKDSSLPPTVGTIEKYLSLVAAKPTSTEPQMTEAERRAIRERMETQV